MDYNALLERNAQLEKEIKDVRLTLTKANRDLIKYKLMRKDLNVLIDKISSACGNLSYEDKPTREAVILSLNKLVKDAAKVLRGE